jgi:DNA repair and recombination protein RAD52
MKPDAIDQLNKPLNKANVSQRTGAGNKKLDYLEGWFVIEEANRIFGFDGWTSETTRLELIGTITAEPDQYGKTKHTVGYRATVRVKVGDVVREGCGFGNGIDANPINAHELALKEAETDARKRAFMTFGNPFGLALYDKERTGVEVEAPKPKPEPETLTAFYFMTLEAMKLSKTKADLNEWYEKNKAAIDKLNKTETSALRGEYAELLKSLPIEEKENA